MGNDFIFVIQSFLVDKNGKIETGVTLWFKTEEDARTYLEKAGRPTIIDGYTAYWDDPCECRWDYVVIEKVYSGRSVNEVVAWYKYQHNDELNRNVLVEINDPPYNDRFMFNLTGIG